MWRRGDVDPLLRVGGGPYPRVHPIGALVLVCTRVEAECANEEFSRVGGGSAQFWVGRCAECPGVWCGWLNSRQLWGWISPLGGFRFIEDVFVRQSESQIVYMVNGVKHGDSLVG